MPARPAATRPLDPRPFIRNVKRRLVILTATSFGAFWLLAAGNSVGVTANPDAAAAPVTQQGEVPSDQQQPASGYFRASGRGSLVDGGSGVPVLGSGSS